MATVPTNRVFARVVSRVTSNTPALRHLSTRTSHNPPRWQKSGRRQYSSGAPRGRSNTTVHVGGAVAAVAALVGGYYYARSQKVAPEVHLKKGSADETIGIFKPTAEDYQKVYNAIAKRIWDEDDYDDGSYGPVLLRLSFHASGTYDAATDTGGSNGATMRFAPEKSHNANKGMENARNFLEPIKEQFPWISYSDLWTLGGVCAVQEMQGPVVPWRPGRRDRDESWCSPDGRLPNGSKGQNHVRAIFGRMGFNDQEIVALLGAHALGRCHTDRSGFDGPWTFSPTVLTNDYYRLLVEEKWRHRQWDGPKQYQDESSKSLMMLPTDMALVEDPKFREFVVKYAEDADAFFDDFSTSFCKLIELGVPFKEDERLVFETFHDQEEEDKAD